MKKILKNLLIILILLLSIIGLTGCGKKENKIFEAAKNASEETKQLEKATFNGKFKKYEGTIKGQEVRMLLTDVKVSNQSNTIKVDVKGITDASLINLNKNYNVKIENNSEGYISVIIIKEN